MFKRIHVYDVDGILLDSSHRHNYFPDGSLDFANYFANCTPEILARDKVLPLAKQYRADCINPHIYTVICSVRSHELIHINSLDNKIGLPDLLLLCGEKRPPCTPGHLLKLRRLQRLFNLRQFAKLPKYFWEDSAQNIEATKHLFTKTFLITDNRVRQT